MKLLKGDNMKKIFIIILMIGMMFAAKQFHPNYYTANNTLLTATDITYQYKTVQNIQPVFWQIENESADELTILFNGLTNVIRLAPFGIFQENNLRIDSVTVSNATLNSISYKIYITGN